MKNNRRTTFAAIALLVLISTSCTSVQRSKCNKVEPVELIIDASGDSTPTVDEVVNACYQKQDVVWIAQGASFMDVKILDAAKGTAPTSKKGKLKDKVVMCVADSAIPGYRCTLAKGKHDDDGWISYEIVLTDAKGSTRRIDPYVIIKR